MTTRFTALAASLSLSATLMAGCATKPYVPTLYDAEVASVETIALADVGMPDELGANELASHLGTGQAAGGIIGALVVAGMEAAETSARKKNLAEIMDPLSIDWETEFETMLTAKLAEAGYGDVAVLATERAKKGPLQSVPESAADAVLDIDMTSFGVQKAQTGQEWRPAAGVSVQLLKAGTGEMLMENVISYNSGVTRVQGKEGAITLFPDAASTGFLKIKEMDGEVVAEEIRIMMDEITSTIVGLLA